MSPTTALMSWRRLLQGRGHHAAARPQATPQAGLRSPYNSQIDAIPDEGHKKYLSFGCKGCHGGGGMGNAMCIERD